MSLGLVSPEPRTHWEGCTPRPSKAASPWSRTTSGGGSVTPPLKTCSIHSEMVFYIRSSPRNRLVFYAHIFQRGRDRRICTSATPFGRRTSWRCDVLLGSSGNQFSFEASHGSHVVSDDGGRISLVRNASFRLKRAMARIWFRTTGEGKPGWEPRAWVSGDGLLLCWVGVGHRLSVCVVSLIAPPTSTCVTLASTSTGLHCCGREVHGIEGPPPEYCIWIFAEVHFM